MTKPSQKLISALLIIRDQKPLTASRFAKLMWPDSRMHRMVSNQGHGSTRGKAAWLCAGSYLGKIEKAGWIKKSYWWANKRNDEPIAYLTVKADELLAENNK